MNSRDFLNRRQRVALATVPVIAAAAFVWHHLPVNSDIYGPFAVHGRAGAKVTARTVAVTVRSVETGAAASAGYRTPITAAGRWVVVSADLAATTETILPRVELVVGPNTYTPTDRFPGATLLGAVDPGISQHGCWVFDVATELLEPRLAGPLQLRVRSDWDPFARQAVVDLARPTPARSGVVTIADAELRA